MRRVLCQIPPRQTTARIRHPNQTVTQSLNPSRSLNLSMIRNPSTILNLSTILSLNQNPSVILKSNKVTWENDSDRIVGTT